MITYQEELLSEVRDESLPLLKHHWEEIALDRDTVPLEPDWGRYKLLEDAGILKVLTVRHDGNLIGYAAYLVNINLHYMSQTDAIADVLYVTPEHRKSMIGLTLLSKSEEMLKPLGVTRIIQHTKLNNSIGPVLERAGYKAFEMLYAKRL
jgi:GNAT superfamily N-acetyltransferase